MLAERAVPLQGDAADDPSRNDETTVLPASQNNSAKNQAVPETEDRPADVHSGALPRSIATRFKIFLAAGLAILILVGLGAYKFINHKGISAPMTRTSVALEGELNLALRESGLPGITSVVEKDYKVTLKGVAKTTTEKELAFRTVKKFSEVSSLKDLVFVVEQ